MLPIVTAVSHCLYMNVGLEPIYLNSYKEIYVQSALNLVINAISTGGKLN